MGRKNTSHFVKHSWRIVLYCLLQSLSKVVLSEKKLEKSTFLRLHLVQASVTWSRLVSRAWLSDHALQSPQISSSAYHRDCIRIYIRISIHPTALEVYFTSQWSLVLTFPTSANVLLQLTLTILNTSIQRSSPIWFSPMPVNEANDAPILRPRQKISFSKNCTKIENIWSTLMHYLVTRIPSAFSATTFIALKLGSKVQVASSCRS